MVKQQQADMQRLEASAARATAAEQELQVWPSCLAVRQPHISNSPLQGVPETSHADGWDVQRVFEVSCVSVLILA